MPTRNTPYYSIRTGKHPTGTISFGILLELFLRIYDSYESRDYFVEYFGYYCVDSGNNIGVLGHDIESILFLKLRKSNLWPIKEKYKNFSEADLFDLIEFLYDCVSKPEEGWYHDWNECGMHWEKFSRINGRTEYRSEINQIIKDYGTGFELSEAGELLTLADEGLTSLLEATVPQLDETNITQRVNAAILKFRRRSTSEDEKKDVIRDLADVLEYLRPQAKKVLAKKDENDLFVIANNFAIRHHNPDQKSDYDKSIWYSWIFYFYLSTIHATIRLILKKEQDNNQETI